MKKQILMLLFLVTFLLFFSCKKECECTITRTPVVFNPKSVISVEKIERPSGKTCKQIEKDSTFEKIGLTQTAVCK
jgi:hypothetical protein